LTAIIIGVWALKEVDFIMTIPLVPIELTSYYVNFSNNKRIVA